MTQEDYFFERVINEDADVATCPVCWTGHARGQITIEEDGSLIYQSLTCPVCGATWREWYELQGYVDLRVPPPNITRVIPVEVALTASRLAANTKDTTRAGELMAFSQAIVAAARGGSRCTFPLSQCWRDRAFREDAYGLKEVGAREVPCVSVTLTEAQWSSTRDVALNWYLNERSQGHPGCNHPNTFYCGACGPAEDAMIIKEWCQQDARELTTICG
jgi:hypothetical protein